MKVGRPKGQKGSRNWIVIDIITVIPTSAHLSMSPPGLCFVHPVLDILLDLPF